ncbi:radical SAM/SPASM domain Clo7bot peptide maturase [Bacteroides sp. f07]|uniref:radical SAM/SPASM domain-containing protein n=1 Tax=Bacteroides TaxID=816 RepID=UPI0023C9FFAD|nr:radical SAM protein [Bacteroides acidifaciens]MDE6822403.1 SPASM domain-containing protein [Bacteroides acidifaciens]
MMKVSKYTFLFDVDNSEFYVYNTLSNALIEIEQEAYQYLLDAQKSHKNIDALRLEDELYSLLILKKMIVENDIDAFLFYKAILTNQRFDQSHMHLTIAPTMDCCFSCHYCFEKYKAKNYLSDNVADSIIKYLKSLNRQPGLKLTWFGGEPLMALPQIENFYKKLVAEYKKPIDSNMITSGFHIDENAIKIMQNINLGQIQITLDGLPETHNKIKNTEGCKDAFERVMKNIDLLLEKTDIHVSFRVNLTKQNATEYVELYAYLLDRYKRYKKKGISPAFVMDRGGTEMCEDVKQFFTPKEASQFVLDLYNKYQIHSPFLRYPPRFFTECAIRNVMSISFDPEGYAYKCWEVIGNKKYAIGKLDNKGRIKDVNENILNRHLYAADPLEDPTCSACRYLPICNGGCPIQRIENVFEGKKNNCCTFYKGRMEEFLKIHLKLKKMGFENK